MRRNEQMVNKHRETLGDRLRIAREDCKLNQAELAKRAGVSSAQICSIEGGNTSFPNAESIYKICEELRIRATWLLFNDGTMRRKAPEPVIEERIQERVVEVLPMAVSAALMKVTESMQWGVYYHEARDNKEAKPFDVDYVRGWLDDLLAIPNLRVLRGDVTSMPEATAKAVAEIEQEAAGVPGGGKVAVLRQPAQPAPPAVAHLPERLYKKGMKLGAAKPEKLTRKPRADGLLRVQEVCNLAGIPNSTFYRLRESDPDFPANRAPKGDPSPAYKKREVEEWIAKTILDGTYRQRARG